jgi:hypothetical protein
LVIKNRLTVKRWRFLFPPVIRFRHLQGGLLQKIGVV